MIAVRYLSQIPFCCECGHPSLTLWYQTLKNSARRQKITLFASGSTDHQSCRDSENTACTLPNLQEAESKTRMLCSVWNVLDFAAFFPPLFELALMYGANLPFRLGRFDLRWFKILRCAFPFPPPSFSPLR